MRVQIIDIQDVKRANENAGYHFFEPATMRFFASRTSQTAYQGPGGTFFVTSEQYKGRGRFGADGPRLYSVRRVEPDGGIDTVGEFQQYENRNTAHRAARRYAEGRGI